MFSVVYLLNFQSSVVQKLKCGPNCDMEVSVIFTFIIVLGKCRLIDGILPFFARSL